MITKKKIINFLTIITSIFICCIILNAILFFSGKHIRQNIISKKILNLLPIEMTYFYSDTYLNLNDYFIILGDSHAFGSGDSFLNNDYDYSISHHLYKLSKKKKNFLNIGFPGGGSQAVYNNYLNFKKKVKTQPKKIIYLFYEGNDLEDNIIYKKNYNFKNKIKEKIRYYFPLFHLTKFILARTKNKLKENIQTDKNEFFINNKTEIINIALQAPPIELNKNNINISLNILYETLINLKKDNNKITLIYLPSPASVLSLKDPIYFQKYFKTNKPNVTTAKELEKMSAHIKKEIKSFSLKNNIDFLDVTKKLRNIAKKEKVYGPKDYKHFNKYGYQIIANEVYKKINF